MAMTPEEVRALWTLDPDVTFLNHGSFGACPRPILDFQMRLRERMESEPVRFLYRELEGLLDGARIALAAFLRADPEGLAFVSNATTGVNTVLRSLRFAAGDEILVTDHEYPAVRSALRARAQSSGARIVVVRIPFPVGSPEEISGAILEAAGPRTRLAVLDHVTSQTALVLPVKTLAQDLRSRGIPILVDGAHAPGQAPLDLSDLGAAFYTGNCHKWLCAPKGAAFLHVREDYREQIHPLSVSHGRESKRKDRSRFHLEFDWTGTADPTPFLCIPECLLFFGNLLPGGWEELMAQNRTLALQARELLCQSLGITAPCPESMVGSMASLPLPDAGEPQVRPLLVDPLQERLWRQYRIEVPVIPWPEHPRRLIRVSCQIYNRIEEYRRLAEILPSVLEEGSLPIPSS